ncbi:hypothetical protein GCQ56_00980 [Marinifilum sp. N1E240]|uniref:hypothetical protein n=1 Tax=Marinifilum sp. N1E240 TaxID=2608082 RepID=UPI00128D499B|nr:hypothetical protein [Marinifilum sp. N1E240]MPQ45566.1 hypothetical protein [Marinifilum sp. N1E240]
MKIIPTLIILLLILSSCSSNRYLLDGDKTNSNYLSEFITELSELGEISKHPMLVIDGEPKRWDVELKSEKLSLKGDQIASVDKMDQEKAEQIYGEPAKDGVILVKTKQKVYDDKLPFDKHKVLYFLDNKVISLQELKDIDPNTIGSITVIKGKEDMKPYTTENYDGVVIINTK